MSETVTIKLRVFSDGDFLLREPDVAELNKLFFGDDEPKASRFHQAIADGREDIRITTVQDRRGSKRPTEQILASMIVETNRKAGSLPGLIGELRAVFGESAGDWFFVRSHFVFLHIEKAWEPAPAKEAAA